MTWRHWAVVIVGAALLAYAVAGAGRKAPARGARARSTTSDPTRALPLERAEVPGSEERGVVEAGEGPEPPAPEPATPGFVEGIQDWEAATEGALEGRLLATRGIESWSAWRVYVTGKDPVTHAIKRQKHADVDPVTGRFLIEELPLGKADLVWYHPAAGMSAERFTVKIESGLNTVELSYDGPDPGSTIFVSVTSDEPVDAGEISATDGARILWAEALSEGFFAIPNLPPGSCEVTIDHPGKARQTLQASVGTRLRVELE